MNDQFYNFLVENGYKVLTPSGNKSTVYSYCKCIDQVCKIERMSWEQLSANIKQIILKYDFGGIHEDIGMKSNRTCINALKAFSKFSEQ